MSVIQSQHQDLRYLAFFLPEYQKQPDATPEQLLLIVVGQHPELKGKAMVPTTERMPYWDSVCGAAAEFGSRKLLLELVDDQSWRCRVRDGAGKVISVGWFRLLYVGNPADRQAN